MLRWTLIAVVLALLSTTSPYFTQARINYGAAIPVYHR